MKQRNNVLSPEMEFRVMDVTDMSELATDSFDIVIDKGTLDCLDYFEDPEVKTA